MNNNNSFENKFKRVLALHLQERTGIEICEVLSFREQKGWIGADDTFGGSEVTEVSVKILGNDGEQREITLHGNLGELVQDLFNTAKEHGIN